METTAPSATAARPTQEQIAAAAFHLYLNNGRQDGHDLEDWYRAEEILSRVTTDPADFRYRLDEAPKARPRPVFPPVTAAAKHGGRSDRRTMQR